MLTPDDLRIPHDFDIYLAADTGTFMSALLVAIGRDYHAYVLQEFPNYRYVSNQIELNDVSVPEWAAEVVATTKRFQAKPSAWADPNTQFRAELRRYGLRLLSNLNGPETRVAIAREYFHSNRIHLTPWLAILPYELENAQWPDEVSASGRFQRLKRSDHTLVCLEHILSRRPRGQLPRPARTKSWLETYLDRHRVPGEHHADTHLGRM